MKNEEVKSGKGRKDLKEETEKKGDQGEKKPNKLEETIKGDIDVDTALQPNTNQSGYLRTHNWQR